VSPEQINFTSHNGDSGGSKAVNKEFLENKKKGFQPLWEQPAAKILDNVSPDCSLNEK